MVRYLVKANENIRFVYSQVASQTNWLLFRAERPRDKFAGCKLTGLLARKFTKHAAARDAAMYEAAQAATYI
jgi:hypothetical protein